jgi:hypothetical protein
MTRLALLLQGEVVAVGLVGRLIGCDVGGDGLGMAGFIEPYAAVA